jgi:hypothetical protein
MNSQRAKRPCTYQPDATPTQLPGRDQLLLKNPELQSRLGKRYCDESELLPLLLSHGLVVRVRTFEVFVHPLGGNSFKVALDSAKPSVGEAKAEISRVQGTEEARLELYRVAVRVDGGAVREEDAKAEPLDEDGILLGDGEVVAMAVKELPLIWRTFAECRVALSEEGAVATQSIDWKYSLVTTGVELTEGKHYWEVELRSESAVSAAGTHGISNGIFIGISRPNLDPTGHYYKPECVDCWFIYAFDGSLYGDGKDGDDAAGGYEQGDRVGVLLDLGDGSLRFFRNGAQHSQGYGAGTVTGPVVAAVQMIYEEDSVRLLPNAQQPQQAIS